MTVRYETDGPVATVTIDRQERANSVDRETSDALVQAFERFDADETLNVAILTGAGKNFCAGGDLKAMRDGIGIVVTVDGNAPLGPGRMELSKPVIAAVEGNAVAGGLELALWCDLRVAARDATFGVYCRRWGIPLCDGGTVRLPRLIGQSHALDMILTGRGVSGEEAYRMGLANRLCEPGEALSAARNLAETLARLPQGCMRSDRRSSLEQWTMPLQEALRNETERGLAVISSGETVSGLGRWASKEWSYEEFREDAGGKRQES
ncbi:MAG TPA: crotonase/enoyl-CoA hydratase family protein [Dehalococcoidia bacterium]|jgi:enoyl-CoA hydratase|nr:crotonase/enoyl-CoA hydratase family protein [Dehalococcoidia bacterium]